MENNMFCYQCQETAKGTGCTIKGVCGKTSDTSGYMDLLLFITRGISIVATELRTANIQVNREVNLFITDSLFTTITNANFDNDSIIKRIEKGIALRDKLKVFAKSSNIIIPCIDEVCTNINKEEFLNFSSKIGVLREKNEDIRSLKELIIYGLKGIAAYHEHAIRLGFNDDDIHCFTQAILSQITIKDLNIEELVTITMQTGEYGVKVMSLLDKANTTRYGNPEITKVNIGVGKNPGILITGHDLRDIEELLKQTEDSGIDIYTHGEMLPAHYYPELKKYKHFVGNYGNAWWKQREEFSSFNGPIVFTTNCIVPPLNNSNYKERMFTSNSTGYPGCKYIETDANNHKNFSEVIEIAKRCIPPTEIERGEIIGGFAHNQVLLLADQIIDAIKSGAIRKFVVMAGCDGRMNNRNYYTEFAQALPKDAVILTAGCAKYKYNKLNLGDINGIPRVLDAGQCNDSYSLAVIALKLKEIFELNDINDLPIVYNIAWYEQKAVIVLLALLNLGVKNIHLGPTLPAFLSPNITSFLVKNFGLAGIGNVDEDMNILGL